VSSREGAAQHQRSERPGAFAGAPITLAIIVANVLVFAGEVLAARSPNALVSVPGAVWFAFGANYAPLTLAAGQYDRLLASCFVHASLLHVAMNMWSLRNIGPFVERTVGTARYPVLYVITGIAGAASSIVWGLVRDRSVVSVGASGAVCGVMAAALVLGVRLEGWGSPIARQIGFWLLVIFAYGASVPGVDNAAHVGGMISGALVATAWRRGVRYSTAARWLSIGLSAAACIGAGAAVAYRDVTDPFAQLGPNDRAKVLQKALRNHDCAFARRALLAIEAVADTPDVKGLRADVESQCPPGAP
jgi:rhomboid protease GluP